MPPTLILIRHAQGLHNVYNKSSSASSRGPPADFVLQEYGIRDPPLSELGYRQCRELEAHLRNDLDIAESVGLIIVSPMRRTLQTAQHALRWLIDRGVPFLPLAEWQETTLNPCDIGVPVSRLEEEFPDVDFSSVDPVYPSKTGKYLFTREAIEARGRECRAWLKGRPEKVIAVVSHSSFLRIGMCPYKWANADYRVFDFVDEESDDIEEWDLTRAQGGGMAKAQVEPLPPEESDFVVCRHPEVQHDGVEVAVRKGEE